MNPASLTSRTPPLITILKTLARDWIAAGRLAERLRNELNDRREFADSPASPNLDLQERYAAARTRYDGHPIAHFLRFVWEAGGPTPNELDALAVRVESRWWIYPDEGTGYPGADDTCRWLHELDAAGKNQSILDCLLSDRPDARAVLAPLLGPGANPIAPTTLAAIESSSQPPPSAPHVAYPGITFADMGTLLTMSPGSAFPPASSTTEVKPLSDQNDQDWEGMAIVELVRNRHEYKSLAELFEWLKGKGYPHGRTAMYLMEDLCHSAEAAGIYSPKKKVPGKFPRGHRLSRESGGGIEAYEPESDE